jgi:hypothetical protein
MRITLITPRGSGGAFSELRREFGENAVQVADGDVVK